MGKVQCATYDVFVRPHTLFLAGKNLHHFDNNVSIDYRIFRHISQFILDQKLQPKVLNRLIHQL